MPDDTDASRPRPRVQPGVTLPSDARLTELGELFEARRLATGLTTEAFLRAHGLAKRTWRRLLYGPLAERDKGPALTTVVQYARAAKVDEKQALTLARRLWDPQPAHPLTPLGVELERCRLATGERTWAFLEKRRLTPSTWYRLLRGGVRKPRMEIVYDYAVAAGLDPDRALFLAGLQEEHGTLGRRITEGRARKQAETQDPTSANNPDGAAQDTPAAQQ